VSRATTSRVSAPRILALASALALALASARPAHAVELTGVSAVEAGGFVAGTVRLDGVLTPRIQGALERGMPTTVDVTVEVWRARPGWFDASVGSQRAVMRVFRNAWSDDFTFRRNMEPERTFLTLEDVEREIERPLRVSVLRVARLDPDARYYLIVRATVKPLTVEDLEAVEKWLSGEAKRAGKPGPGSLARLPTYLVGVLANLSGLGDESTVVRTEAFALEELLRASR
jgi:hypothetical protein